MGFSPCLLLTSLKNQHFCKTPATKKLYVMNLFLGVILQISEITCTHANVKNYVECHFLPLKHLKHPL